MGPAGGNARNGSPKPLEISRFMAEDKPNADHIVVMEAFTKAIPHVVELGIEVESVERGTAIMRLPYQERFVGNPETGVLHGGVVTTLIDTVCGLAVVAALDQPRRIATIDLRIDYVRPASPGDDLIARADCFKVTRQVAFVRCVAYQGGEDDLVASASGTFMIHSGGRRRPTGSAARERRS